MSASIEVNNVSLVVPYYAQPERAAASWLSTLFGAATAVPRRRFTTILDDVTFTAREGDRIALVGRNGAGKSTLLRVLAGAFEPTRGTVKLNGSHQALLSMGLGFNNEATIMENIFLRATAMRIPAKQVRNLVDPVLDFSGLRSVANRRLLTLSSGQRMRLGFAISTAIQHDIMLLDEWFGAGDAQFTQRARTRLMDRIEGSGIVVVASHNAALLKQLCNRAIFMDQGKLLLDGDIAAAFAMYRKLYPPIIGKQAAARKKKRKPNGQRAAQEAGKPNDQPAMQPAGDAGKAPARPPPVPTE